MTQGSNMLPSPKLLYPHSHSFGAPERQVLCLNDSRCELLIALFDLINKWKPQPDLQEICPRLHFCFMAKYYNSQLGPPPLSSYRLPSIEKQLKKARRFALEVLNKSADALASSCVGWLGGFADFYCDNKGSLLKERLMQRYKKVFRTLHESVRNPSFLVAISLPHSC